MMKVKFLGHAAFCVEMDGKRLLFDPWIEGNPQSCISVEQLGHVDLVLVSHDHDDHIGQAFDICRRTGATLVAVHEIAVEAAKRGLRAVGVNVGGPARVEGLEVVVTPALHSSGRGIPVGFIVRSREGSVYHAGDTGLFYDIKLYAELYPVDIAMVPIGGHYTMDPLQAAVFTSLLKPRVVIPMHYNTFPAIRADPQVFAKEVTSRSRGTKVVVLKPCEEFEL
ncbi:MAG: metal-dependent hydrolase [Thermoprotei archaeon]|nr:MAG: metal-dependent hydrolase [Thermoprotei archaeon]RLE98761.1 MAG: metal-dependent hydrolase [Thermoprotei archaeon]